MLRDRSSRTISHKDSRGRILANWSEMDIAEGHLNRNTPEM